MKVLVGRCSVLTLGVFLLAWPAMAQEPEFTGDQAFETTEVADGVYRFRHMFHNTLFVVTDDGVIAFDPLNTEAAGHYAAEIQRVAPGKKLLALVYSHDHGDHVSGGPELFEALGEAPIIAHENAYVHLSEAEDAARPLPDITFKDELVLRLGGRTIELHYVGKTHSDNMIVAYIPGSGLAFAVDFVSHDAMGYRDLASWYYPELYNAIERLQEVPFETIVFGHGPVGDRSSVDRQLQYYLDLRDAVQAAIDAGLTRDEAIAQVDIEKYRDWQWYDDWFSMNVDRMYQWLAPAGQ